MVTLYKQKQLKKAALSFIKLNAKHDYDYRFDVIAINILNHKKVKHHINHIKNAF